MLENHSLVFVTPVYEDLEASSQLFKDLAAQFGTDAFVVAVDDGSVRKPLGIEPMREAGINGVVIKLVRNVGHQKAISTGLGYVAERIQPHQRVVVMDSDGEDIPKTVPNLIEMLDSDEIDVVVAQRASRVETLRFKVFYFFYKRFFSLMTGRKLSFGNFMALKPAAVKRLVTMQETSIHVAGAVIASKLRTAACPLHRGPRYAGQSKMNFVGLALHGFKGLMVFAEDVLVRVGITCSSVAFLSILGAILAILLKLVGFSTPGWFSVALGILLLIFLQTGALTLMTLMLTGVVRGGMTSAANAHHEFIDRVMNSSKQ